ncbi:uncharacterized protein LOC124282245 [Haliotis rubra]|uniref:uncharacterized protein LOC124282245 n=1 Tax=Haliotis rubra TaxID=36100 RepID=UPI001EE55F70|nr:uncharacterized protein LOC124282245 [Haliotis rubra]
MVGVLSVGSMTTAQTTPPPDTNVTCEANVDENGNEVEYSVKCVMVKEDAGQAMVVITRTTNKGVARLDYCINPKRAANFLAIQKLKGRVFFKDGEMTATIKVPVKNNNLKARIDEVHIVEISKPTTGKVKKGKAEIVVLDDD